MGDRRRRGRKRSDAGRVREEIDDLQGRREMRKIQILGTGCPKCSELAANAEVAALAVGDCEVEKITDVREIMEFGVMMTPALAVEGVVKAAGKVLSPDEIEALLS